MKLVEILAEEMEEWPAGVTHLTQSNVDREIYDARDGNKEDSVYSLNPRFDTMKSHTEDSYPIVTRAQWQAERDRQKGGDWKRHRGNKLPIDGGLYIEAKLRCGDIQRGFAQDFIWPHAACDVEVNLMKYRVISQPQEEEVEVNVRVDSAVNVEYAFGAPDADMSKLDWRVLGSCNLDSIEFPTQGEIIHGPISMGDEVIAPAHPKWDQVDGPLLWRDTVNELDAYIEEFTREREALIERLASEGFALIPPVVTIWSDILPFEDWEVGDVVEVTSVSEFCNEEINVGDQLPITRVDKSDNTVSVGTGTWSGADAYKFIRRP